MLDEKIILDLEKRVIVSNDPFPHTVINNFLPLEIVKKAEKELSINHGFATILAIRKV